MPTELGMHSAPVSHRGTVIIISEICHAYIKGNFQKSVAYIMITTVWPHDRAQNDTWRLRRSPPRGTVTSPAPLGPRYAPPIPAVGGDPMGTGLVDPRLVDQSCRPTMKSNQRIVRLLIEKVGAVPSERHRVLARGSPCWNQVRLVQCSTWKNWPQIESSRVMATVI